MIRKTGFRKKAGKFFAVLASAAMVVTSIPMNYGYAKADSVQTVSEDDDSKTPTVEKNASDVAVLKKIIAEQKERGADVSEDLDDPDYGWEEIDGELRLTNIYLADRDIQGKISFTGLSELNSLKIGQNKLTNLDVSENKKLEILDCSGNQLTELNMSQNVELTELDCWENQLQELDVSNNTKLTSLGFYDNQLTEIDVSKCNGLIELECSKNRLSQLDLSQNVELTSLDCYDNEVSELDLSENTKLDYVYCNGNQLTKLDVSQNTKLSGLYCTDNQLQELDVSKNTKLTVLDCSSNPLQELDVSNNKELTQLSCIDNQLSKLDVSQNTKLTELDCWENQLEKLDVGSNAELNYLRCQYNKITVLDISKCNKLIGYKNGEKDENGEIHLEYDDNVKLLNGTSDDTAEKKASDVAALKKIIAEQKERGADISEDLDSNEYKWSAINGELRLTRIDWNHKKLNGEISFAGLDEITALCISWDPYLEVDEIGEVTGINITENTKLQYLNCASEKLTELDVSKNTKLERLECGRNQLQKLDVSENTKLTYLDLYESQLPELDVSKNTELEVLECQHNRLQKLDVSKSTKLYRLCCYDNQLPELDVSENTSLQYLFCEKNQLTKLDVTNNTELDTLYCQDNKITTLDISNCKDIIDKYLSGDRADFRYDKDVEIIMDTISTPIPTKRPTASPSTKPTKKPTASPSIKPTATPTVKPTVTPSVKPTEIPTASPSTAPTGVPVASPSTAPTKVPTASPSVALTEVPTATPTINSTEVPTVSPSIAPTATPTINPTEVPTEKAVAALNVKNTYTKYLGDKKFKLNAKTDSDGTVRYKSSNTNVVKVSSKGEITIVGCGEAKVTISVNETDSYKAVTKKVTIKVLPETVQNFKVKALSGGKIKCTWKGKSTKNTNCQIQYSLNKQFKNVKTFASKPSLKSGSYKGKGLKKGKTYYLRIRATAKSGGKSYTGKWSKTIKVKVK